MPYNCKVIHMDSNQPIIRRCFIENDYEIEDDDKRRIERTLYFKVPKEMRTKISFDKMFDIVIVEAFRKPEEVWRAVLECDEIYMSTGFIGESAYLLEDMCEQAIKNKITNKTIINFRNSDSHLQITERGSRMLQILMKKNNIKYLSQDADELIEIVAKMTF